jgi:putative flippase GtrA
LPQRADIRENRPQRRPSYPRRTQGDASITPFPPWLQVVWSRHRDKILYLVVGGWNTLFTWVSFSVLYYLLHTTLYASVILLLSYAVASLNGFLGFRYIVFGASGSHPIIEYLRYQAVYLPLLLVNMVLLPLLLKHTPLNAYVIQAAYGAFSVVFGYLGNKYFTFRRADHAEIKDST